MFDTMKRALTAIAAVVGMFACANSAVPFPSPDTELNDVDPRIPLGRYVQYEASNTVAKTVILTNGVLTVGNETINVAEPSHTVVETNVINGMLVITTNTYDAVYQDNLSKELESYATIKKAVVTENEDGTKTTNWVDVAYLNDLPPDDKKADKVINLWEYHCPQVGGTLTRTESKIAPFAAWSWDGDENGVYHIELMYTGGVWSCSVNDVSPPMTVRGSENAKSINFGDYTFKSTNENGVAYVVYTDALKKARKDFIDNELVMFVSKTNMTGVAETIQEDQLTTIQGIVDTLMGIRRELLEMSGNRGMSLSFTNVTEGLTLTLGNAEVQGFLGRVDINWGDGFKSSTNFPCSHTYSSGVSGVVEVAISGRIKSISGSIDVVTIYPFASWSDGDNSRLFDVQIDRSVGLEEIGDYAFAYSGLKSLSFARDARVSKFGKYCFYSSAVETLYGMPDVGEIPDYCFAKCNVKSMNGLADTVGSIGTGAFSDCKSLRSLGGIGTTAGPTYIGESAFFGCTSLVSLAGMEQTGVTEIPDSCFSMCSSLSSIAYLNQGTTKIGNSAFLGTAITTLNGLPQTISEIGESAFAGCSGLTDARALWNTSLSYLGDRAFQQCSVNSITFPETLSYLGELSLYDMNAGGTYSGGYKATVKFRGKTLWEAQTIPVSSTNESLFGFSWGLPKSATNDTLIIGVDGDMYFDPSMNLWITNSTEIAFSMRGIPANTTIMIGGIEEAPSARDAVYDGSDIAVDWGDGTREYGATSHTYTTASSPTIKVYGKVSSVSGQAASYPFIAVSGSPTNAYLVSASFIKSPTFNRLGAYAFAGCSSLEEVQWNQQEITEIGTGCFTGASSLTNLLFLAGTSIDEIPAECFRGCSGIKSLEGIPSAVSSIGDGAFRECSSLESIEALPSLVKSIPQDAFRRCTSLTSIDGTTAGITTIGKTAFAECIGVGKVSLDASTSVAPLAFSGLGSDATTMTDEDGISYKTVYRIPNGTYYQAAQLLGLETASGDPSTGIDKSTSKIECADEEQLVWHSEGSLQRWEVLVPALEIELKDVTSNTTFQVARTWVASQASVIWNWGDGTSMWVSQSPSPHTYTNSEPRNYTIRIKGLLDSISAEGGAAGGAYIRPQGETENPFLVGFRLPETTPMRSVGSYSFSRCPNLKNINRTNLPRSRALAPPIRREEPKTRLEQLFQSKATLPIEYGEFCFYGSGIEDMSGLPTNTTQLAEGLFSRNENLKSLVTLPGDYIVDMGDNCFEQTGVTNLYGYPKNIGYVGNYSFANCYDLNSLYGLPTNILTIGNNAFDGCIGITSLGHLSEGLSEIGICSFKGTSITSLDGIPTSVNTIKDAAFMQCASLTSTDGLNANISKFNGSLFMGCTNLTEVVGIPNSVNAIDGFCFFQDTIITNIIINDTITEIGASAFPNIGYEVEPTEDEDGNLVSCTIYFPNRSCSEIRELWETNFVTTAPNVKLVGWNGYIYSSQDGWTDFIDTLSIKIRAGAGSIVEIGIIGGTNENGYVVYWGDSPVSLGGEKNGRTHTFVSAGTYTISIVGRFTSISSYDSSRPFFHSIGNSAKMLSFEIGNNCGVVEFGESCFRGMNEITNLDFISSYPINTIGARCFAGCTNLVDISGMPSTVNTISDEAFDGCTLLGSLYGIPISVTNIPSGCFRRCTSLKSIDGISPGTESIGDDAFYLCSSILNLNALTNTSLGTIGRRAFYGCSSIKSIASIPESVYSIGDSCFKGCSSLMNLDGFEVAVTNLPPLCFADCTSIVSITGMTSFVTIGSNCFAGCTSLLSGNGFSVSTNIINRGMFKGCTSLKDIEFVDSWIELVDDECFRGCSSIREVDVPTAVKRLGDRCFYGCMNITNIEVHTSDLYIGVDAFVGIGLNAPFHQDEFGNRFQCIVRFSELTVSQIIGLQNFPFGAPDTTVFVGKDGFSIAGIPYRDALEVDIFPDSNGNEFEIQNLGIRTNCLVAISWGDGTGTNNISKGIIRHKYSANKNYTIKFFGDLLSVSTTNVLGSFVATVNGDYNPLYQYELHYLNTAQRAVRVPSGSTLESIGQRAFYSNSNLTNVTISSSSLTNIGNSAFKNCSSISNFWFDVEGLKSIQNEAFAYSSFPKDIKDIPSTVESFGDACFTHNMALTKLWDSSSENAMKEIGVRCFSYCSNIVTTSNSIYWPTGIDIVTNNVLYEAAGISSLYLQTNCIGIMDNALYNIGSKLKSSKDELGNYVKTKVYILHKTCEEIMGKGFPNQSTTYFPFGATRYTKFFCKDGTISKRSNSDPWEINRFSVVIWLNGISNGSQVTIGNTTYPSGGSVLWNFGDGTTVNTSDSLITHTYHESIQDCMIAMSGKISGISGTSTRPWVSVRNGGSVVSVDILEDSEISTIGNYSFYKLSSLGSAEINSTKVRTIGNYSFSKCTSLTNVVLPKTSIMIFPVDSSDTYSIGYEAFCGCTSLRSVNLEQATYNSIGDGAFAACSNLEYVVLRKATMPKIGVEAFEDIGKGQLVTNKVNKYGKAYKAEIRYSSGLSANPLLGDAEMLIASNYVTRIGIDSNAIITTDDGYVGYNSGWKPYEYAVSFLVGGHWNYSFGLSGTLPTSLKKNFSVGLSSAVRIGNMVNITTIPTGFFQNAANLSSIVRTCGAASTLTRIEDGAFKGCSSLSKMVKTAETVTYIGEEAFSGCRSLPVGSGVTFPACTHFGGSAFLGCSSLSSIQWMKSNAFLGTKCFEGCTGLTSMKGYPNSTTIPMECFKNSGLQSLSYIPSSVKSIETSAFEGCSGINDVSIIPNTVESIGDNALLGALWTNKTVCIPHSLKQMGKDAYGKPSDRPPYLPLRKSCIFDLWNCNLTKFGSQSLYYVADYITTAMTCTNLIKAMNQNRVCLYNLPMIYTSDGVVEATRDKYDEAAFKKLHNDQWGTYTPYEGELSYAAFFKLDGTFSSPVTVFASFGSDSIISFGDGSPLVNQAGSKSYSKKPIPICVHKIDISENRAANSPAVLSTDQSRCYVSEILMPPVSRVGSYALSNLTKCRKVKFYGNPNAKYYNRPAIANNAFTGIGSSLSVSYYNGLPYKTLIILDYYTTQELLNNVAGTFPFGAPSGTLFQTSDGYIYSSGSGWDTATSILSITVDAIDTLDGCNYYNYFLGDIVFENGQAGYVSIDGGSYKKIEGATWLNWSRGGAKVSKRHTITIKGRIFYIGSLIDCGFNTKYASIVGLVKTDTKSINTFEGFGDLQRNMPVSALKNFFDGTESIGGLGGMSQITDLNFLPTSLISIRSGCFDSCGNLRSLSGIGKCTKLKYIGSGAFNKCYELTGNYGNAISTYSYIPPSVLNIESKAFWLAGSRNQLHLCFKGRTVEQIQDLLGYQTWNQSADVFRYYSNGEGPMRLYGSNGCTVDVSVGGVIGVRPPSSYWRVDYFNTGL